MLKKNETYSITGESVIEENGITKTLANFNAFYDVTRKNFNINISKVGTTLDEVNNSIALADQEEFEKYCLAVKEKLEPETTEKEFQEV